jgi:Ca2+-binding RTX toxin-like protein
MFTSSSRIESLEARRLLSVSLSASGVLTITGTDGDDSIRVGYADSGKVAIFSRLLPEADQFFDASLIKKVIIRALGGNDDIGVDETQALFDKPIHVNCGAGNDTFRGGLEDDRVLAGPGNDFVEAFGGKNHIEGGAGNDDLRGGDDKDKIIAGPGNDNLVGFGGNDLLRGGAGNDTLLGFDGNDLIFCGPGNDQAFGGGHNDTMFGGAGNDSLAGETGHDLIFGRVGVDTLLGGDDDDTLWGGGNEDVVDGGAGNNTIVNRKFNNLLRWVLKWHRDCDD